MKITLEESFSKRFEKQLRCIANDSLTNAKNFKKDVISKIKSLDTNPMRCRKSIYFEDESIRDLIFKGYVIQGALTKVPDPRIKLVGYGLIGSSYLASQKSAQLSGKDSTINFSINLFAEGVEATSGIPSPITSTIINHFVDDY